MACGPSCVAQPGLRAVRCSDTWSWLFLTKVFAPQNDHPSPSTSTPWPFGRAAHGQFLHTAVHQNGQLLKLIGLNWNLFDQGWKQQEPKHMSLVRFAELNQLCVLQACLESFFGISLVWIGHGKLHQHSSSSQNGNLTWIEDKLDKHCLRRFEFNHYKRQISLATR